MVIVSGMVTSRTIFSFGSLSRCPVMRWTRRRNEATERSRSSSAESAVTTVSRPRRFSAPARGRLGRRRRARGRAAAADAARRFLLVGFERRARAAGFAAVAVSAPKRFLATSSALRLVSSSCLRRSSSSRLRASAASRVPSARLLRGSARMRGLFFGDLALFRLAQARVGERVGARARAPPRSACAARRRTAWARRRRRRAPARPTGAVGGVAPTAALAAQRREPPAPPPPRLASPGPATRRFTFSTTTALLRPWLKLWRTTPCSTPPRLSVSVFVEVTLSFSPVFLVVSVIRVHFYTRSVPRRLSPAQPLRPSGRIAGPKPFQAPAARQNVSLAGPASRAACITFGRPNAKSNCAEVKNPTTAGALPATRRRMSRVELADPVGAASAACSRPATFPCSSAASVLAKPAATSPALPAIASASMTARSSSRSVRGHEVRRQANFALEAAGERLALDRLAKGAVRCGHPDAAARQFTLEIGHRLAFRSDDEPDQLGDRPHRAGRDA